MPPKAGDPSRGRTVAEPTARHLDSVPGVRILVDMRSLLLWASENQWCGRRLPRYRFVKRAVRRFMPGETLDDALAVSDKLARKRISALVSLLGENVGGVEDARSVARHYAVAAATVASRGLDAEISLKPTHLGLDLGAGEARKNIARVVEAAAPSGNWVWLDMEYSRYVDPTLDLYRSLRAEHANVGICLQAYLHRTRADLEALLPSGPAIRLVKGAYAEPPDVAMPRKEDVDRAFYELALRMLSEDARRAGLRARFATHDGKLIRKIDRWVAGNGGDWSAFEYQMLYGIAAGEQNRLAREGRGVRVLVSYGRDWFPWYARRLAERPANLWFVLRHMVPV